MSFNNIPSHKAQFFHHSTPRGLPWCLKESMWCLWCQTAIRKTRLLCLSRDSPREKKKKKNWFLKVCFAVSKKIKVAKEEIQESSLLCNRKYSLLPCSCSFSFPLPIQTDLFFLILLLSFFLYFYLFPLSFITCLGSINTIFSQWLHLPFSIVFLLFYSIF